VTVLGCESRTRIALRFIAIKTTIAIFLAMKDKATVKTFDDLEIHRPELARGYLQLLNAQPHRPIALFAPRRVGKTFFLENDLSPAAHAEGFITVYADLWLHKRCGAGARRPSSGCLLRPRLRNNAGASTP
jgi:hypothetical protein